MEADGAQLQIHVIRLGRGLLHAAVPAGAGANAPHALGALVSPCGGGFQRRCGTTWPVSSTAGEAINSTLK